MALIKSIETNYGVNAEYHKIAITAMDWHNKQSRIEVMSFVSKDARETGKAHIGISAYDFNGEDFTFDINENIIEQAYEKIKALPLFEGAVDDL